MGDERQISPASMEIDGRSETDEFDLSSLASTCSNSATALRVTFDLHRQNSQLLREKRESGMKHDDDVLSLRRRIADLEQRIVELTATKRSSGDSSAEILLNEKYERSEQEWRKYRAETEQQRELIALELDGANETIRVLEEMNSKQNEEVNDLNEQLIAIRTELQAKNDEMAILRQAISEDDKASKLIEQKTEIDELNQHVIDLMAEREANEARMQSVMDVQTAHAALRRDCQTKENHNRDLEDVLDKTIREKEKISAEIMKLREESQEKSRMQEALKKEFDEFRINAEAQYEDTCNRLTAEINARSMISYGAAEYPGKGDNVLPSDEKLSSSSISRIGLQESRRSFIEYGSGLDESSRYHFDVLAAESTRTIETLRSEYEIEVARNGSLQQENDRLIAERERLRSELYGEMQNGSISSLNCVMLTSRMDSGLGSIDSYAEIANSFRCLKLELGSTIQERNQIKEKLSRLSGDLERQSTQNFDLRSCLENVERESDEMRAEANKTRKIYYDNLLVANRCKALVYQKQYLTMEVKRVQELYFNASKRFCFNGLSNMNGKVNYSGNQSRRSARSRFKAAVVSVLASIKMRKLAEKRRKQLSAWFSE